MEQEREFSAGVIEKDQRERRATAIRPLNLGFVFFL